MDGGYVALTLERHWQIPAPFRGTLIGIPTGGSQSTKKPTPPSQGGKATNPPVEATNPLIRVTRPPTVTPEPTVRTRIPVEIVETTRIPVEIVKTTRWPDLTVVLPTPTPVVIR